MSGSFFPVSQSPYLWPLSFLICSCLPRALLGPLLSCPLNTLCDLILAMGFDHIFPQFLIPPMQISFCLVPPTQKASTIRINRPQDESLACLPSLTLQCWVLHWGDFLSPSWARHLGSLTPLMADVPSPINYINRTSRRVLTAPPTPDPVSSLVQDGSALLVIALLHFLSLATILYCEHTGKKKKFF